MPDGQSFVMVDHSEAAALPTQMILIQNWAEELKQARPHQQLKIVSHVPESGSPAPSRSCINGPQLLHRVGKKERK